MTLIPSPVSVETFICIDRSGYELIIAGMEWLPTAREVIEKWRVDYNNFRPHTGLGGLTPSEFANSHNYALVA